MIETLRCLRGHTFTRERKRGRKPALCPTHTKETLPTPAPVAEPRPERSVETFGAVQPSIKPRPQVKVDTLADQVRAVLNSENVDHELKRKLKYCQDEIDRGRDDQLITNRRKELLRESKR